MDAMVYQIINKNNPPDLSLYFYRFSDAWRTNLFFWQHTKDNTTMMLMLHQGYLCLQQTALQYSPRRLVFPIQFWIIIFDRPSLLISIFQSPTYKTVETLQVLCKITAPATTITTRRELKTMLHP